MNSGDVLLEPDPMLYYNDPLMLCMAQNLRNECTFVFKSVNNDTVSQRTLILDNKNFYSNSTPCTSSQKDSYYPDTAVNLQASSSKLPETFRSIQDDQPEFIDVNNLTFFENAGDKKIVKESIAISDDDSDVIFVKEYKNEGSNHVSAQLNVNGKDEIRRNPMRKARSVKSKRHLQNEHFLEEDFDVLDEMDESNLVFFKNKSNSSNSVTSNENFKEWPVNAYERPEYNPETKKIEPFDYTIRKIQVSQTQQVQEKKKCYIEVAPKIRRKSKKKYFIRKRRPKNSKIEKKVPVEDLKVTVKSTFDFVSDFFKLYSKDSSKPISTTSNDGIYNLLKNQTTLLCLLNGYKEDDIKECVGKLVVGS